MSDFEFLMKIRRDREKVMTDSDAARFDSKYSEEARRLERHFSSIYRAAKEFIGEEIDPPNYPPRPPGSERSYVFKGPLGTRYSDRPEPKEGEVRVER